MKHILEILVWTVVAAVALHVHGAELGPADLAIVGPEKSAVNETVRLKLDGLPAVDLQKTMAEQLAWVGKVRVVVDAPRGVSENQYSLDQQLSVKLSPFVWSFMVDFKSSRPGDYVLVVAWFDAPYGLVHHRIQVGGGGPPPDPTLPPENPVDPNLKVSRVTYVYEKDQSPVPRPVSKALQRINAESSGSVVASEFEEDTVDGTGETPDQYKIALEAARKAGLPSLVVQVGNVVKRVLKAPTTEAEVIEALK